MQLAGSEHSFGGSRERFIAKVFNHLGGAILAFTAVEVLIFSSGLSVAINQAMRALPWIAIMGAFILISWLASRAAHQVESLAAQYAALGVFIVAEAIIFVPLLTIANQVAPGAISNAGLITVLATLGLVGIAYVSRKDFSFLGSILKWGGLLALVTILCGAIFGFELGMFFSIAMIGLAGGAILYDASNIIHHYPEDRYVGAALELFASVAMMFWYVLRLFLRR
ncbi:MAG: Bax inhibitor-1/YccA family protein [Undibacterium curvum]|uniref:US12 family protein n=1 Tax=Undibacterium curvum TaxID=2762294 RepID=A0ABR7A688_9BURK|nr:Bax inhibitor-1 family protein [Undibacterium curvum]MBC3932414.1 US12 family protein [Undibacterium curvum]